MFRASRFQETHQLLDGDIGNLEAVITEDGQINPSEVPFVGVICHPHPLHGGTMNNKVVHTMSRAFRDLKIPSIRFNYPGVYHIP